MHQNGVQDIPTYNIEPIRPIVYPIDGIPDELSLFLSEKNVSPTEIFTIPPRKLSLRLGVSLNQVKRLRGFIRTLFLTTNPKFKEYPFEFYSSEQLSKIKLTIDGRLIDDQIGGGIPLKSIIEIAGEAATGKTQYVCQLLLRSLIPPPTGLNGSSALIFTEGSFQIERLKPIAEHLGMIPSAALARIHILTATEHNILKILQEEVPALATRLLREPGQPPLRLLAIDSVGMFRGAPDRQVLLQGIEEALRELRDSFPLTILLINQVTDYFEEPSTRARAMSMLARDVLPGRDRLVGAGEYPRDCVMSSGRLQTPALGLWWPHFLDARIMLSRDRGVSPRRRLHMLWSRFCRPCTVPFLVRADGVVGVPE
eukprot:gnl/Dysnectes_brevis/7369_a12284_313.p1 GENE.gnl/Dysnectes_brevis/7369_a12284_313~~gnl/Dysnectes_brevis/7369_a12284_313.p1  ORF type:complete len:369 (-),score=16.36 gnl/Dysnectes_brevis/7369_a12284_313:75-1181(-)